MEKRKKSRRRKLLIWLGVDLSVALVVILLLLHKPSRYNPAPPPAASDPNSQQIDPYLHRDLWSKFYNGAQRQRPFEMVVLDQALNEAIAKLKWPQETGGLTLSAPQVLFTPGRIVLMGTTAVEGAEFVITIVLAPRLDEQGKLNLVVDEVKVGAMPVTLLAKMTAKKMFKERLESAPVDMEDLRTKIAASLFNEEPFDPVLKVEDKWVRLKSFELTGGKLTAQFDRAQSPRSPTTPGRNPAPTGRN